MIEQWNIYHWNCIQTNQYSKLWLIFLQYKIRIKWCDKEVPALEMSKSTSYTCGVLSGVKFVGYYFMIIFEIR